ncbi:MAG: M23 family metallopeptidase [Jatrophihabitans sp.]
MVTLLVSLAGGAGPVSHHVDAQSAARTRAATEIQDVEPPVTLDVVTYSPPVSRSLEVLRGFDSTTTYGPGHRGLDLYVSLDRRVLAAADGVVAFAGSVAGRGVLVLRHGNGIRTEYEPVHPVVGVGTRVSRGTTIGLLAGRHRGCVPDLCLHWGARRGEAYLDPLDLLRALGPVRLLPWTVE